MASFRKAKSGCSTGCFPVSGDAPICLMTCPMCGKAQPCAHSRSNAAVALDSGVLPSHQEVESRADQMYWRQEIVARVQQHRARRRRRFDADASLELNFPAPKEEAISAEASQQAAPANAPTPPVARVGRDDAAGAADRFSQNTVMPPAQQRNIIRFPRNVLPETALAVRPFVDELELAEPAPETPRILDAPEARQMELLYAFTDIALEESTPGREELDLPPQPATLHQRAVAALVDGVIVLAGAALFTAAFVEMSGASVQGRAASLGAAAVIGILWLLFQHIFLVYGRGTPGMRSAGLEVCNLAGERPSRFARRSRGPATMISALSLGVGFVWAFIDEDTLGWHDRISGTYMRSSTQRSAISNRLR
jgi:uncharacterized RDD family membrane protein YckC